MLTNQWVYCYLRLARWTHAFMSACSQNVNLRVIKLYFKTSTEKNKWNGNRETCKYWVDN